MTFESMAPAYRKKIFQIYMAQGGETSIDLN